MSIAIYIIIALFFALRWISLLATTVRKPPGVGEIIFAVLLAFILFPILAAKYTVVAIWNGPITDDNNK